jgi:hypothetical protein
MAAEALPVSPPVPQLVPARTLAAKLALIASECGYVQKDKQNDFHRYRYASASAVLGKVNEALAKHRVASTAHPTLVSVVEVKNAKGNPERLVTVNVTLRLHDADSGETFETSGLGSGQDTGDKAVMKAQTAGAKYAWMLALNISTGDDPEDDPDVDRRAVAEPQRQAPQQAAPARQPAQAQQHQPRPAQPPQQIGGPAGELLKAITACDGPESLGVLGPKLAGAQLNETQKNTLVENYAARWEKLILAAGDVVALDEFEAAFTNLPTGLARRISQRVGAADEKRRTQLNSRREPGQEG